MRLLFIPGRLKVESVCNKVFCPSVFPSLFFSKIASTDDTNVTTLSPLDAVTLKVLFHFSYG